jgi:hypothetical protein
VRFIGDIHGKIGPYLNLLTDCTKSTQVGDFGVGFGSLKADRVDSLLAEGHRFIRGNHDSPAECAKSKQWIPDGHYERGMMFVGGANSIDREYRIEGVSWWLDEELSYSELGNMIDRYIENKPRVMVTHDAPESAVARFFNCYDGNRTRQAFENMLAFHRPEFWIFGHWHRHVDCVVNGTRFICLAELEFIDLEIAA